MAPFATAESGVVVNAAIELRVQAEVIGGTGRFLIESRDPGRAVEQFQGMPSDGSPGGPLALQKAALARAGGAPVALRTRSAVPRGSGLGSSGALGVALVAALDAAASRQRTPVELAEAAFELEVVDAMLPGGRQDQYAAALGGFHRLDFSHNAVAPDPLPLDPAFTAELGRRIVLCFTGASRVSSHTISRVMGSYAAGAGPVVAALRGLVTVAERMAEALRASDLAATASLLSENWRLQQQLDAGMRTPEMARLEQAMAEAGILGGKAAGAGAGGSMFFIARDPVRAAVAARETGAQVLEFTWSSRGVIRDGEP